MGYPRCTVYCPHELNRPELLNKTMRMYPLVELLLMLKCCFPSTETVGLLGTGAQDVHLDFHTAPELCVVLSFSVAIRPQRLQGLLGTGSPRRLTVIDRYGNY